MNNTQANVVYTAVVKYILDNEPQRYTQLHERASTKEWYTPQVFDKILIAVAKHTDISATVDEGDIIYRRKQKRVVAPRYRIPCPPLIAGVNDASHEIFDAICFCYEFCKKGESELMHDLWKSGVHKKGCYLYNENHVNTGRSSTERDTEISTEQEDISLESE